MIFKALERAFIPPFQYWNKGFIIIIVIIFINIINIINIVNIIIPPYSRVHQMF